MRYHNTVHGASRLDHPTFPTTCRKTFAQALHKSVDLILKASFVPDDRGPYKGLYRGARCELPTGEVIEVHRKRTPLYDLARDLQNRGYGEWQLQAYTHNGTPSIRDLVKVMAGLTVEESDRGGLKLRKYRPFPRGGRHTDARVDPAGTRGQSTAEAPSRADRDGKDAA